MVTVSLYDHLGGIAVVESRPGVGLASPDAEGDFLFHAVEGEDINVDFGAGLQDFTGARDPAPGKLGDVGEAVGAAQVDERAEAGQVADASLAHLADLQLVEELLAAL